MACVPRAFVLALGLIERASTPLVGSIIGAALSRESTGSCAAFVRGGFTRCGAMSHVVRGIGLYVRFEWRVRTRFY